METPRPSRTLRLLVLLAVVLNAVFGYFYRLLPLGLEDMRTASDHYPNLFMPAPYAFSIWGLIYFSWLLYAVYALLPSQRRNPLHDRLSGPLILVNLMASAWIIEFTAGFVGISQIIIGVMLAAGAVLFLRARQGTRSGRFMIPFSLFLGWISVANLVGLAAWLSLNGWRGGAWGEVPWTILLIAVAVLLGLIVGWRYRDFTYPLVIAWAILAIGMKQRFDYPGLAFAAFAGAVLSALWALFNGIRALRPVRPA